MRHTCITDDGGTPNRKCRACELEPKFELVTFYAIRTKLVAEFPSGAQCPFQKGAFMAEDDSPYGGLGLRTVFRPRDITFYETPELAKSMIERCKNYAAKFEVVPFKEQRYGK